MTDDSPMNAADHLINSFLESWERHLTTPYALARHHSMRMLLPALTLSVVGRGLGRLTAPVRANLWGFVYDRKGRPQLLAWYLAEDPISCFHAIDPSQSRLNQPS